MILARVVKALSRIYRCLCGLRLKVKLRDEERVLVGCDRTEHLTNNSPREMFWTSHRGEPPLGALWRPTRVGPSDFPPPAERYWVSHEKDEKINQCPTHRSEIQQGGPV